MSMKKRFEEIRKQWESRIPPPLTPSTRKPEAIAVVVDRGGMLGYVKPNGTLRSTSVSLSQPPRPPPKPQKSPQHKYLKISRNSIDDFLVSPQYPSVRLSGSIRQMSDRDLVHDVQYAKKASLKETTLLLDQIRRGVNLRSSNERVVDKMEIGLKEVSTLTKIQDRFRKSRGSSSSHSSADSVTARMLQSHRSETDLNNQSLEDLQDQLQHKRDLLKVIGKFNRERPNIEREAEKLESVIATRKASQPRKRQKVTNKSPELEDVEIGSILLKRMSGIEASPKSTRRSGKKSSSSSSRDANEWI